MIDNVLSEMEGSLSHSIQPQISSVPQASSTTVILQQDNENQEGKRSRTSSTSLQDSKSLPQAKRPAVDYFSADAVPQPSSSEKKHHAVKRTVELKGIFCMDVDPRINTKDLLNFHFSKFGVLTQIKCAPLKKHAYVRFKNHASATKAKKKGSIFSDEVPPMKLYWLEKVVEKTHRSKKRSSNSPLVKDFIVSQSLAKPATKKDDKSLLVSSEELRELVEGPDDEEDTKTKKRYCMPSVNLEKPVTSKEEKNIVSKNEEVKSVETTKQSKNWSLNVDSTKTSSGTAKLLEGLQLPALSIEDKFSKMENRDKLLLLAETNDQADILKGKMIGTCPDMCPEKERYMRKVTFNLSVLETNMTLGSFVPREEKFDHKFIVKEYSRSSADQQKPLPHELRPPRVLLNTMNYLVCNVMDLRGKKVISSKEWYNFLWNRTRSIRKDIAQQQLCDPTCVEIMEKCTRFHILCIGELSKKPLSTFDPKINNENLTKSLQTLKHMYSDLRSNGIECPNEAEFRGYDILLSLSEGESLRLIKDLRSEIRKSLEVKFALNTALALTSRNYVRFFKLVQSATYLKRCILMRFANQVRMEALHIIVRAFCPPNRTTAYSTSDLMQNLGFRSISETVEFCQGLGLEATQKSIHFHKKALIQDLSAKMSKSHFLLRDKAISIAQVVCNGTVPENPIYSYNPSTIFDDDGYLKSFTSSTDIDIVWRHAGLSACDSSFYSLNSDLTVNYEELGSKSKDESVVLESLLDKKNLISHSADSKDSALFLDKPIDITNVETINEADESIDMIAVDDDELVKSTSTQSNEENMCFIFQDISQSTLKTDYVDSSSKEIFLKSFKHTPMKQEKKEPPKPIFVQEILQTTPKVKLPNECLLPEDSGRFCLEKPNVYSSIIRKQSIEDSGFAKNSSHSPSWFGNVGAFQSVEADVFYSKHAPEKEIKQNMFTDKSYVNDPLKYEIASCKQQHLRKSFDVLDEQSSNEGNIELLALEQQKSPTEFKTNRKWFKDFAGFKEYEVEDNVLPHKLSASDEESNCFVSTSNPFSEEINLDLLEENKVLKHFEADFYTNNQRLAEKVFYRWKEFCLKQKSRKLLNKTLPVHPILGFRSPHPGHETTVSPIEIIRNFSNEHKFSVSDKLFPKSIHNSHCNDFIPILHALSYGKRLEYGHLKANHTAKFWTLLILLPEKKSNETLTAFIEWIVGKFSSKEIALCKDGSYILSCFQLPSYHKKVIVLVQSLILNKANIKAIKNNRSLLCGISAVLVGIPNSFAERQDLCEFYELLECALNYMSSTTIIPPFGFILLRSWSKFSAIEKYHCFIEKYKHITRVKSISFFDHSEHEVNLNLLKKIIAWFVENENESPIVETSSFIKYVEDTFSFAINYMYDKFSYAKIKMSTMLPNLMIQFFNKVVEDRALILKSSFLRKVISIPQELLNGKIGMLLAFDEQFQNEVMKFMLSSTLPLFEEELNISNVWKFVENVATSSGCDFSSLSFSVQSFVNEIQENSECLMSSQIAFGSVILTCALHIVNAKTAELGLNCDSPVYWLQDEVSSLNFDEEWQNLMSYTLYINSQLNPKTITSPPDGYLFQMTPNKKNRNSVTVDMSASYSPVIGTSSFTDLLTLDHFGAGGVLHRTSKKVALQHSSEETTTLTRVLNLSQIQPTSNVSHSQSLNLDLQCEAFHTHKIDNLCSQLLEDILFEKQQSENFLQKLEAAANFKNHSLSAEDGASYQNKSLFASLYS